MKPLILFFTLNLCAIAHAKHFSNCLPFLNTTSSNESSDITDNLIGYLSTLIETGVLSTQDLEKIVMEVKTTGHFINPLVNTQSVESKFYIHSKNLEQYIHADQNLDKSKFLVWAEEYLKIKGQEAHRKKETQKKTNLPHRGMRLNEIEIWQKDNPILSRKKIAVMDTPVTEGMWVDLMEGIPALINGVRAKSGYISITRNGKVIEIQPDHPITRISWLSAMAYANALSKKHGLKEVYDFSASSPCEGDPALGTFKCKQFIIKINAPDGDIYQTEGFRLPTRSEQKFLITGWKREKVGFPEITKENIDQYAWTPSNTPSSEVQEVAQLQPLLIQGKAFFDLFGNVEEYSSELRTINNFTHVVLSPGGSVPNQYPRGQFKFAPDGQSRIVGFRLVRTLPK